MTIDKESDVCVLVIFPETDYCRLNHLRKVNRDYSERNKEITMSVKAIVVGIITNRRDG